MIWDKEYVLMLKFLNYLREKILCFGVRGFYNGLNVIIVVLKVVVILCFFLIISEMFGWCFFKGFVVMWDVIF